MKWIVTGSWLIDGKAGRMTVEADSLRGAMDAAKAQGLSGFEAIAAGNGPAAVAAVPVAQPQFHQARAVLRAVRVACLLGWVIACAVIIAGGPDPMMYALGTLAFFLWLVLLAVGGMLKYVK